MQRSHRPLEDTSEKTVQHSPYGPLKRLTPRFARCPVPLLTDQRSVSVRHLEGGAPPFGRLGTPLIKSQAPQGLLSDMALPHLDSSRDGLQTTYIDALVGSHQAVVGLHS